MSAIFLNARQIDNELTVIRALSSTCEWHGSVFNVMLDGDQGHHNVRGQPGVFDAMRA